MFEMKPCPACGNPEVVVTMDAKSAVHCPMCGMYGPCAPNVDVEYAVRQWNALPRALEGTNEPPKVPGWYWMFARSEIAIGYYNGSTIRIWGSNIRLDSPELEGVAWAGPIPEPREPK